jgi:hypothetical protein
MSDGTGDRLHYPWWVRVTSMAGGRSRGGQWVYVGLSAVAAAVCAVLLMVLDLRQSTAILLALGAVGFVVSAAWYLISIRWLDRHGGWHR